MSAGPPRDSAARRRAATDFDVNLVVEAGAGAGKTSLLVERTLNAIGSGETTLDRMAAITFTERAAGEMRERLAAGLDRLVDRARGASAGDAPGEADRAFDWLIRERGVASSLLGERALEALDGIDAASISTIHAFCSSLLREFPFEAGVDPDFAVDPGTRSPTLIDEAWQRFLAAELGPRASRAALWREVLQRFSLATVGEIARGLVAGTSEWGGTPGEVGLGIAAVDGLVASLVDEIDQRLAEPEFSTLTPKPSAFLTTARRVLAAARGRGMEALVAGLAAAPEIGKRNSAPDATKAKSVAADYGLRAQVTIARLWRLVAATRKLDDDACRRLAEAVAPFVDGCGEMLLRAGLVTFDMLLVSTRDLLRADPGVRGRLKRRYRMLLVDEFQDTDPVQYEIVLLLAERDEDGTRDPWQARLAPGRLFVVGDPKQSIYRFRGADYAGYRRAADRIVAEGGARVELTANFRSVPDVLDPVNALFVAPGSPWRASPEQPDYVPILAERDPAPADGADGGRPRVEILSVGQDPSRTADVGRLDEARAIAAEILRLREAGTTFGGITVLLRAMGSLGIYQRGLREAGVPFVVDGGREFARRPEVAQLTATLRALAQPADAAALLAFLRSPAGGVPDTELAAWAAEGGRWSWRAEPEPSLLPALSAAFDLLRRIDGEIAALPVDAAIRRVVDATSSIPLAAAAHEGAQRVANLRKLVAAAGELARDGGLSLEQVTDALSEGRAGQTETDSPLADDRTDAVRICTIHRMKGLENRTIVLADLMRQERHGPTAPDRAAVLVPAGGQPTIAIRSSAVLSAAEILRAETERRHEEAEEIRVLYVALTRARERLILLARPCDTPNAVPTWARTLAVWGYDPLGPTDGSAVTRVAAASDGRVALRLIEAPGRSSDADTEAPAAVAADAVVRWHAAIAALARQARPAFDRPSAAGPGDPFADDGSGATRGGDADDRGLPRRSEPDLGRAVGTAVHRLLARHDPDDEAAWRDGLEAQCAGIARDDGLAAAAVVAEAARVLDAALASELGARLRAVDVVGRELPLLLRGPDGARYRGSIDLLYRDADGSLVVADYKTDAANDNETIRARHAAQLGLYAEAVRGAFGLAAAPRAEIWLLRHGRIVTLSR